MTVPRYSPDHGDADACRQSAIAETKCRRSWTIASWCSILAVMPLPPIQDMAIFAHVVEAQSFTAAAERLGISKSAVSKSVAALEEHLGVRLLHRTTRKLRLTDAGIAFHAHCERILCEATEAELAVGRMDGRPRGKLRINAPTTLGRSFVLPVVLEFMRAHPEVEVDLAMQDETVDLVATATDVAIRVGRLVDGSVVAKKLVPVRGFLVASPAYLAAHGTPKTPEDLAQHTFIRYTLMPKPDRVILVGPDGERATVKMTGALSANHGELVIDAVLAGLGIGLTPDFIGTDAFCDGRLQVVLPDWQLPTSWIQAVYPQGGPVTPAVRHFIDALVARVEVLKARAGDRPFALALRELELQRSPGAGAEPGAAQVGRSTEPSDRRANRPASRG